MSRPPGRRPLSYRNSLKWSPGGLVSPDLSQCFGPQPQGEGSPGGVAGPAVAELCSPTLSGRGFTDLCDFAQIAMRLNAGHLWCSLTVLRTGPVQVRWQRVLTARYDGVNDAQFVAQMASWQAKGGAGLRFLVLVACTGWHAAVNGDREAGKVGLQGDCVWEGLVGGAGSWDRPRHDCPRRRF